MGVTFKTHNPTFEKLLSATIHLVAIFLKVPKSLASLKILKWPVTSARNQIPKGREAERDTQLHYVIQQAKINTQL